MRSVVLLCLFLSLTVSAFAMSQEGCGAGECNSCHSMTIEEAKEMFPRAEKVISVDFSEMPGVFVVELEGQGQRQPVYVDFSKKYVVSGNIFRLADGKNISEAKTSQVARKIDPAKIPVDDAVLVGKAGAKYNIIVFTDPDCPWCKKLHVELKQVVKIDPEIAFQIKMFPLAIHKDAYAKSKSIVCLKSADLLDAAFAGAPIPSATCETDVVDKTIRLANELGIRGTPAIIFPDGFVKPGFMKADDIIAVVKGKN